MILIQLLYFCDDKILQVVGYLTLRCLGIVFQWQSVRLQLLYFCDKVFQVVRYLTSRCLGIVFQWQSVRLKDFR